MCSRVFLHRPGGIAVVCRSLDWNVSDEPRLWVLPAGLERRGAPGADAVTWRSEHASMVISGWDATTGEGLNDAGLAAHLLYLEASAWEPADERPAVANLLWAQWALDTCATVDQVIAALDSVRVVDLPVRGVSLGVHLAVEDRAGNAAVIEVLPQGVVVHQGADARVVTNDPPLDEQIAGLAAYAPFGGPLALPGDVDPISRFVRGRYFLDHLPDPADAGEALAGAVSVIRSMSVPFGAPSEPFGTYPTWWISATDLDEGTLMFQSTRSPFAVWATLDDDLVARAAAVGPLVLDPEASGLAGDVSGRFAPAVVPY